MIRLIAALALAGIVTSPAPAATCQVCTLQLTSRSGPYVITLSKEPVSSAVRVARMDVTIVNRGIRPIVFGTPTSARVLLNSVAPRARGIEVVDPVPGGRTKEVGPGSSTTFRVTYPYRLGRPGTYAFNVSYGGVDSNIVTYFVK